MTAPDRGTIKPENSCIEGAVHTWLDTGHGPLGWTMGAGSGRLLAALMTGAPPPLDPAPYAPGRFSWLEMRESVS
jgi:D-amino-acid dehydrogenase